MNDFNKEYSFHNEHEHRYMENLNVDNLIWDYITNDKHQILYNKTFAFTLEKITLFPDFIGDSLDRDRERVILKPFKINTFEETLRIPHLPKKKKYSFKERIKILFTGRC